MSKPYEHRGIFQKRISTALEVIKLVYMNRTISAYRLAHLTNKSESYIKSLCMAMKKVGVLKSTRGFGGGFSINGELRDITARDVLIAVGTAEDPYGVAEKFYMWCLERTEELTLEELLDGLLQSNEQSRDVS